MAGHDQRLKELLCEAFAWFLALILPGWEDRFALARTEWLRQETTLDPPQGERRILDLVARLHRRAAAEDGSSELLAHVEIEWEDRATRARRQLSDGYAALRQRHGLPVLPLALYLRVGLDGRGTDGYGERTDELEVYSLRFPYLGLPALDAGQHVAGDNLLGVALSGLMRMEEGDRPRLKAGAMQRIATADLTPYRRFLLMECIDAYSPLDGPYLAEFERLLRTDDFKEAQTMVKTTYEKGIEQGIEKGIEQGIEKGIEQGIEQGRRALLRDLLEAQFGPLSEAALARLAAWPAGGLAELGGRLRTAGSLAELGLEGPAAGGTSGAAGQAR